MADYQILTTTLLPNGDSVYRVFIPPNRYVQVQVPKQHQNSADLDAAIRTAITHVHHRRRLPLKRP